MAIDRAWLAASSDVEEAASLTAHLVSFRSNPGEEGPVQRAVTAWLRGFDVPAELVATEGDRPNVVARIENGPGPTFFLNGHVDTVLAAQEWTSDPWTARRDGDRLYGLGAADMKGGVAANMLAIRALNRRKDLWKGTIIFSSVVDEEAYSIGARALVDAGIRADAGVVTEGAWDHPALGGVGKVLVRAEIRGKAAHGSMPAQGINAAVEAARLVARLDELPLGRHARLVPTQSVLSLHSGSDQYVITVPEKARFTINRHIVPGETGDTVLREMRVLADSLRSPARFDFAIDPPYYPPWEIDAHHPFVAAFSRAFETERGQLPEFGYNPYVADTNYFSADLAIPTLEFGPRGANYHQADEWVDVTTIGPTVRVLLRLALEICQ